MQAESPRALTEEERGVLDFLLSAEFPGAEALRAQARHAQEPGGEPCPCGCPTFSLTVDRSLTDRAALAFDVPVIVSASYSLEDGTPGGELLLFQAEGARGWIGVVEVTWYGDEPPSMLPPPSLCHPPEPDPRLFWDPSRPRPRESVTAWKRFRRRVDDVLLRYLARNS